MRARAMVPGPLIAFALAGCGASEPPAVPPPTEAPPRPESQPEPQPPVAEPKQDVPAPAPALAQTDTWPFVEWDHAKAYVFNLERGPGLSLYAYNESKGWNVRIHSEQDISKDQADKAVSLARNTLGTLIVSKCALPRHGVVLFSGDTPVASINVCFECGDILVWPKWDPTPDGSDRKAQMRGELQKAYDRTFPKWETFFGDTLGLQLDYTKLDPAAKSPP